MASGMMWIKAARICFVKVMSCRAIANDRVINNSLLVVRNHDMRVVIYANSFYYVDKLILCFVQLDLSEI